MLTRSSVTSSERGPREQAGTGPVQAARTDPRPAVRAQVRAVLGSPACCWPLLLCHLDPGCCVAWMGRPLWLESPGGLSPQRLPPPAAGRFRSHCLPFTPASEEGGGCVSVDIEEPALLGSQPLGGFGGCRKGQGFSREPCSAWGPEQLPHWSPGRVTRGLSGFLCGEFCPVFPDLPASNTAPCPRRGAQHWRSSPRAPRRPVTGVSSFLGSSRPDTELGSQGSRSWSRGPNIPAALTLRGVSEPRNGSGSRSVSPREASAGTEGKRLQANRREDI